MSLSSCWPLPVNMAPAAIPSSRFLNSLAADSWPLVKVSLVTGKRNQIRVQAGLRGCPLLGERQYRFGAPPPQALPRFGRQALHAWRLGFRHPVTGRPVTFTAEPPEDFTRLLAALRSRP